MSHKAKGLSRKTLAEEQRKIVYNERQRISVFSVFEEKPEATVAHLLLRVYKYCTC